jgi:hypothetical protein
VAELAAELFGRSFLPFPHFAAIDHYIMRVALSLDLDLAKFDQSCSHFSIFHRLDLKGNHAVIRVYDEGGSVIQTHEHKDDFEEPRSNPSPPCRQGKRFGFVFRVKYCSRT